MSGLRTLELCVDNLQSDFLYEHIQPFRAELMQALWRTLRNPNDQIAHVAFRVLGKFGGGNRKMMIEPQALEYVSQEELGPSMAVTFPEHKQAISLPVKHIIETAFNALKSSTTEPGFYRKQCWEVIRCYLVSSLEHEAQDKQQMIKLLTHPSFREGKVVTGGSPHYLCGDTQSRSVHQMAVTGMFVAAAIKELRTAVLSTMVHLVRHYTMLAIAQQAGPFPAVGQVTSPNKYVRDQAIHCLKVLSELTEKSITEVMAPHKEVLADMIPPKKHLLRHQPVNAQIGLMDGNTFCTTLSPRLFTIDIKVMEHRVFVSELSTLCEQDDASLQKFPCYKNVVNLVPLRQSALRALAACHYIPENRDKIFTILFKSKSLQSSNSEIAETSFECMKSFIAGFQIDMEMVHQVIRPMLMNLGDYRNLNLSLIQRLAFLAQLFSNVFSEKLCEQLLQHLKKWLEVAIVTQKQAAAAGGNKPGGQEQLKVAAAIVDLFHRIPAASARFIELLCKLVLTTERALSIEPGSLLRDPLRRYLARFPSETLDIFLQEQYSKDGQWSRFVEYLLKHEEGEVFRTGLQKKTEKLIAMMTGNTTSTNQLVQLGIHPPHATNPAEKAEIQFWAVRFTALLTKRCPDWIAGQQQLIETIRTLWDNEATYQEKHRKGDGIDYSQWKEPKLIVKILLEYFKHHQDDHIALLFDCLRALCGRFLTDFQFLKDFLENEVSQKYSVE